MRRAHIGGASLVLSHVPDLVRYGSKPSREPDSADRLRGSLRDFKDAVAHPPNQVFIGNLEPEDLWDLPRPWWDAESDDASPVGSFGEIIDQTALYELLTEVDQVGLLRLENDPQTSAGDLPLYEDDRVVGVISPAHDADEALSAPVLLENLACRAERLPSPPRIDHAMPYRM